MAIKLIVGLGNPGSQYANTRHNAGVWFVDAILAGTSHTLRHEAKFQSEFVRVTIAQHECYLQCPLTYMNLSGQAVQAVASYYKLLPTEILVVHDELDLPVGEVRLKQGGGHGGHNGLRNIIEQLSTKDFFRLRLGIGRPSTGNKGIDYVLGHPSKHERQLINDGIEHALSILPLLCTGEMNKAMQQLHTSNE